MSTKKQIVCCGIPMKTFVCYFLCLYATTMSAQRAVIGFYNLENLYDTIDDPLKNDDEFTPRGNLQWTQQRYTTKLRHLAYAVAAMGKPGHSVGPDLLGVCEAENKQVLEDLAGDSILRAQRYGVVLIEGPDQRGVDPGLLYKKTSFTVLESKAFPVKLKKDTAHKTRDILMVKGELYGEPMVVFVNHWPSRRGGELNSRENRNSAARRLRWLADSIAQQAPGIKIILMGDLNDDPVNESVKKYLRTFSDNKDPVAGYFFNPFEQLYNKGIGSLAYKDNWNLFDQILLDQNCWQAQPNTFNFVKAGVNNAVFLRNDYGNFKGYPYRTYSGGIYTGGYSDHFGTFIVFERHKN